MSDRSNIAQPTNVKDHDHIWREGGRLIYAAADRLVENIDAHAYREIEGNPKLIAVLREEQTRAQQTTKNHCGKDLRATVRSVDLTHDILSFLINSTNYDSLEQAMADESDVQEELKSIQNEARQRYKDLSAINDQDTTNYALETMRNHHEYLKGLEYQYDQRVEDELLSDDELSESTQSFLEAGLPAKEKLNNMLDERIALVEEQFKILPDLQKRIDMLSNTFTATDRDMDRACLEVLQELESSGNVALDCFDKSTINDVDYLLEEIDRNITNHLENNANYALQQRTVLPVIMKPETTEDDDKEGYVLHANPIRPIPDAIYRCKTEKYQLAPQSLSMSWTDSKMDFTYSNFQLIPRDPSLNKFETKADKKTKKRLLREKLEEVKHGLDEVRETDMTVNRSRIPFLLMNPL